MTSLVTNTFYVHSIFKYLYDQYKEINSKESSGATQVKEQSNLKTRHVPGFLSVSVCVFVCSQLKIHRGMIFACKFSQS